MKYETREQYVTREDDISLGPIFNAMRRAQRNRDWPHYWTNCQMANSRSRDINNYFHGFGYQQSLLDAMLGDVFTGGGQ